MANHLASTTVRRSLKEWQLFCEQVQASSAVPFNDTKAKQKARVDRALKDYEFFFQTYLKELADSPSAKFQIAAANKILKEKKIVAVLEWAREHAKSIVSNIAIPMWLIAHNELTGMVLVGKNEDDACNLLSDLQAQLQFNELFAHDFGVQYNFGSWEEGRFTTKNGSHFIALGRKQSPRGIRKMAKRPNLAVVDDVDDDELVLNPKLVDKIYKILFGALYFALSIKGPARMIFAGNRIHQRSVLAHVVGDIAPGVPKREGIFHSKVCAIEKGKPAWPERYTLAELNEKIRVAGPTLANREFFHINHVEGKIFKDTLFHWRPLPPLKDYKVIIGYFDPSFEDKPTSDFKAIRVWGLHKDDLHCIKSFCRRCSLNIAFEWMIEVEKKLPAGVGIIWYCEKQFFNRPVIDALYEVVKTTGHNLSVIQDSRVKENKFTRIVKMESQYTLNHVYYNAEEQHSADMIEANNQVKGIEPGYNGPDDAPDADEGAWHYLSMHLPGADFRPQIFKRKPNGW